MSLHTSYQTYHCAVNAAVLSALQLCFRVDEMAPTYAKERRQTPLLIPLLGHVWCSSPAHRRPTHHTSRSGFCSVSAPSGPLRCLPCLETGLSTFSGHHRRHLPRQFIALTTITLPVLALQRYSSDTQYPMPSFASQSYLVYFEA